MGNTESPTEARARALVQQFHEALDQQFEAAEMRAWPHAPKHIREAHGDPSQPEPPSREAMDAWMEWLDQRMAKWSWRCADNLDKGERAVRLDPSRADHYWNRAAKAAERALAELQASVDLQDTDSVDQEELPDDIIAGFVALLEEHRGRLVVSDSVLPATAARLRAALQQRYQSHPDPALAEALIALPVFVPQEDVAAVERYLVRRTGESGPIGRGTWERGLVVVERIAGEQRVITRRTLGAAPGIAGVAKPIPVLGGVAASSAAAADQASYSVSQATFTSVAWTISAYAASGLLMLVVLGVGGFLVGEPFAALVLVQVVLTVVGLLPALWIVDSVAGPLGRRALRAGKAPATAETAAVALPPVLPIAIAVVSWLIVTSQQAG